MQIPVGEAVQGVLCSSEAPCKKKTNARVDSRNLVYQLIAKNCMGGEKTEETEFDETIERVSPDSRLPGDNSGSSTG